MLCYISCIIAAVQPLYGPIDIHPISKEELYVEWIEVQEERERDEGLRYEFEDEEGNVEEETLS